MSAPALHEFYLHKVTGRVHRYDCQFLRHVPAGRLWPIGKTVEDWAQLCPYCAGGLGSRRPPRAVGTSTRSADRREKPE